jgi:hypothetical protein
VTAIESAARRLARQWAEEVERRRAMSAHDATADILDHCAKGLNSALDTASADDEELSPAEYGALSHVQKSASQVRRWCQGGAIESRRVGRDYRIRRGTMPPALAAVA